MIRNFSVSTLILASLAVAQDDQILFARYPHISHGQIAFSYHGDIWVANEDGSGVRNLTNHVASDRFPRFSPDGTWIAFTSNRMGNDDVFVMPVTGGAPRQVTFHTTGDTIQYWTPDGERLIISTSRGEHAFVSPLHTVSASGDLPVPLEMDQGAAGMISQDGTKIAFNRYSMRYWRKGYKGNSQTDIWVQNLETKQITQLTDRDTEGFREHVQDAYPMWGSDGMIYFMSERSGVFNIWKIAATGGAPIQVTTHTEDGVQYPSISPDGSTIVYENEFKIWKLPISASQPEEVPLSLAFDPKDNPVNYLHSDGEADGFSPSPEGDYVAVDHHGEIFIVPTDPEVGEKKQVTSSAWRDRNQVWSPDGKNLAYISDQSGDEQIWLYEVATGARVEVSSHASLKTRPMWSPDSKQLVHVAANGIFLTDVAARRTRSIAYNENRGFSVSRFSADGKWLVYSRQDENLNSDVYLYETATQTELNATDNPFRDTGGWITPDGKTLVFTSNRDGGANHLFKVSLARLTEDPDDPRVRERRKKAGEEASSERESGGQENEEPTAIVVDIEGIDRRAVQLTTGTQGVANVVLAKDGKKIYFLTGGGGGRGGGGGGLFSIGIDGKDRTQVAEGSFPGLTLTADGKTVFYRQGNGVARMPLSSKKKAEVTFEFSVTVDRQAEWRQIFEESWRIMQYRFYDPNMHGVDWVAIRDRYRPLLKYVGQNDDVYDLSNEMIGELNASHTGVRGPTGLEVPSTYTTALLGFEMEPTNGRFAITHIYDNGPADKEWVDLNVGDYVLSIDGQEIKGLDNYWKILNHTLNDYVTLSVSPSPTGATPRQVRVRTTGSLRDIKYQEWVEGNRDFVEEASNGQIAYVHIRSMNQASLRIFENDIDRFWNAKGIVVDIRYNGGGNIDQQLLDILERRPYEFWNNRWGGRSAGRRPRQAIAGPKVMLINRRSGSDSEVTPMGFRDLGLGRIVGTPTSGAVIATGSYALINGGSIRTPGSLVVTYDPTKPNNYGTNLENYGVAPDVWAENTPQDELDGHDRELQAAVTEALRMLSEGIYQYQGDRQQRNPRDRDR